MRSSAKNAGTQNKHCRGMNEACNLLAHVPSTRNADMAMAVSRLALVVRKLHTTSLTTCWGLPVEINTNHLLTSR